MGIKKTNWKKTDLKGKILNEKMNLKGKIFCYNEWATEEAKSECVPVTMTPAVGQVGQLMDLTNKVPA